MRRDIESPPRTMMEVFQMLPEGTRAELIDTSLYMSPAPSTAHQRILGQLFFQLSKAEIGGEVLLSPADVFLDELSNAVQPDLIYVSAMNLGIIKPDAVHGTPDLLVEVLSKGNRDHDLVRKKNLYERFQIKEYWVIDPDTKESIVFSLVDGVYKEASRNMGKIQSPLLGIAVSF